MPRFSAKKPLTVFVCVLAVLILGVVAYLKMTPDLMPNMNFPYAIIVTADPGASSETVEAEVTRPMEQTMSTLDRLKSVTSTSRDSLSLVVLEFEDGVNMDTVGVDIQQKIELLKGQWDAGIATPYVLKINPSMLPVEVAAMSYGGKDVYELSEFVSDTLQKKLEGISGVAQVTVNGTVSRQAHVVLNQQKMNTLSSVIAEALNKRLDESERELQEAKAQLEAAQRAMSSAQRSAIGGAVEGALGTVQSTLSTLRQQRDDLSGRAEQLQRLSEQLAQTDAELAAARAQIALLEQIAAPSEEQAAQLSALRAEEANLAAQREAVAAQMAALGATPEDAQQQLASLREALAQVDRSLAEFTEDSTIAELSRQVTGGLVSGLDAITRMSNGTAQLSQALTQIEQGLAAVSDYRHQIDRQADLSGMLNIQTISGILTAQNFSMPAGYIRDDAGVQYMVSVGDAFETSRQLENLPLFDLGIEGIDPICLRSVADVFITDDSDEIYAKLNGENGVIISFTKQSNYATAEVSDNIAGRFSQLEREFSGLRFYKLMDQGDYIHLIVKTILSSLLWGALFSVAVLFLFLRDWRPTLITLLSIPISVIFAVVLMYFTGVTINMISLSGLAVSVGMLVDNSVVVIENIYRLRAKGATVIQAAVSGAQQVLGAIVASTLTTVCVFVPIVFVEGITKQLFTDLALTMSFSLLASLIVALTLVPAMACGLLRREKPVKQGLLDRIYPLYRTAARWSLRHKAAVLGLAALLLVGSAWGAVGRGFVFMPQIDMNNVSVTVAMPENCDRQTAVALADEVIRRAMTVENVETVGATMTYGAGNQTALFNDGSDSYDVTLYITLPEGKFGMEAGRRIETLCADMPCQVTAKTVMNMEMLTGSGISAKLYGEDMEALQMAARSLAAAMSAIPGTANVSDGLEDASPALHISIDRAEAMKRGLTVAQIYMQVSAALTGSTANAGISLDGQRMDVVIEADADSLLTRERLLELPITVGSVLSAADTGGAFSLTGAMGGSPLSGMTAGGTGFPLPTADGAAGSFPLGEVATVRETVSLSVIQRDQQRRFLTVSADVADGYNVTKVTSAVQRAAGELALPDSVTLVFDGENEAILDAMGQVMLMVVLGVALVYFIMVAQFQSLKSPFIVMFTLPLAFTGGFLALLISGTELSVISLIGFVMLVGIIVNNGIVLVDYINQLRRSGMERREAIVEAGVTRMRPILMTSLTTILGLIVMALARNVGTSLMQPVALVCIGGLLYATLMTLFVVPCMYDILSRRELRRVDERELETLDM